MHSGVDYVCKVCSYRTLEFPAYAKFNPVTQDYEVSQILYLEARCYSEVCNGGEVGEPITRWLNE